MKPCRWNWKLTLRRGQAELPEESEGYLLARKDMCLLPHVPVLVQNHIAPLKIEGRMRTAEFLAPVVGLAETDCVGCHPSPVGAEGKAAGPDRTPGSLPFYKVAGQTCEECHRSPHRTVWEAGCEGCHLGRDAEWQEGTRGVNVQAHEPTSFALTGRHVIVSCAECHLPDSDYAQRYPDPKAPDYRRQPDNCQGCHEDVHLGELDSSYRGPEFFRVRRKNMEALDQMRRKGRLEVLFNSNVKRINRDDVVLVVWQDQGQTEKRVPAAAVFVLIGGLAPSKSLSQLGIRFGISSDPE